MDQLLALLMMCVHFSCVFFVVSTIPLVFFGRFAKWEWIHNPYYRYMHIGVILVISIESIFNLPCPLTDLENFFRKEAGLMPLYPEGFIDYWSREWFNSPVNMNAFAGIAAAIFFSTILLHFIAPPHPIRWSLSVKSRALEYLERIKSF